MVCPAPPALPVSTPTGPSAASVPAPNVGPPALPAPNVGQPAPPAPNVGLPAVQEGPPTRPGTPEGYYHDDQGSAGSVLRRKGPDQPGDVGSIRLQGPPRFSGSPQEDEQEDHEPPTDPELHEA